VEKKCDMEQSAAKSYAYLLGVFLGDGCVSDQNTYVQSTIDKDFADAVAKAFAYVTTRPVRIAYKEKPKKNSNCSPAWTITITDHELSRRFVADTSGKRVIPDYVFGWDIELRKQFIIGLMDSEGYVATNADKGWSRTNRSFHMGYKSCDLWVPELVLLMRSVGLRLNKVAQCPPRKPGYKTPTRFTIKMQSWIDAGMRFNIARKQSRVDEWGSIGPYERRSLYPRGGPKRLCTVEGCDEPHFCKGLCTRHYWPWKRRRLSSETNTPAAPGIAAV
jgi:hypothetical protein